jgi:hypothetical protein
MSATPFGLANVPLQPRRLMIAPAHVGCKRMLERAGFSWRRHSRLSAGASGHESVQEERGVVRKDLEDWQKAI